MASLSVAARIPGDFRIFIDAATLKQVHTTKDTLEENHFRIFIDAATLKPHFKTPLQIAIDSDFRIFIDAATLKPSQTGKTETLINIFPHLYRCGHIEAVLGSRPIKIIM